MYQSINYMLFKDQTFYSDMNNISIKLRHSFDNIQDLKVLAA
jgi:hypothetical protein